MISGITQLVLLHHIALYYKRICQYGLRRSFGEGNQTQCPASPAPDIKDMKLDGVGPVVITDPAPTGPKTRQKNKYIYLACDA